MENPFEALEDRLERIEYLLNDLKSHSGSYAEVKDQDVVMSVVECAKFLNLSKATIYTLVSKGELPVMKRSKRIYFLKSDLINYLKAGRRKGNDEIQEMAKTRTNDHFEL